MEDNLGEIIVIKKDDDSFYKNKNIKDLIELGDYYIIRVKDSPYELETKRQDFNANINIAIASAVTAYARIHMTEFKNNLSLPNLYYTDSLYFDGPLPDNFISPNILGKLKLEGIYDQALFLAPKVYALKNNDEEIIKIKGCFALRKRLKIII